LCREPQEAKEAIEVKLPSCALRKSEALIVVVLLLLAPLALVVLPTGNAWAAGAVWETQVSGTTENITNISAVDQNTAWAVTAGGSILKTENGGSTWSTQFSQPAGGFDDVCAVDAQTVWALGSRGLLGSGGFFKTTDGGQNWTAVRYDGQAPIYPGVENYLLPFRIAAADANYAWVGCSVLWVGLGGAAVISRTSDGGNTWVQCTDVSGWRGMVQDVEAVDARIAWAAEEKYASSSKMTRTTDGVNFLVVNDQVYARAVSAAGRDAVWGAGTYYDSTLHTTFAAVSRTADGGNTWSRKTIDSLPGCLRISAVSSSAAWIIGGDPYGSGNTVARTADGGDTWSQELTSTTSLNAICAVGNNVWVVGNGGLIMHTGDGSSAPPALTGVSPTYGVDQWQVDVAISGKAFFPGAEVRIEKGATVVTASNVNVKSNHEITCRLNLAGRPLGKYDLVVKNPDGQEGKLTGGFAVTNICGMGAGASLPLFLGLMGLLSLASLGYRRRRQSA
jgi:photosystem II stability/assembly factor-like uncharacterized protein